MGLCAYTRSRRLVTLTLLFSHTVHTAPLRHLLLIPARLTSRLITAGMSQRPGMRNGGARQGPYGPNNAPPPPSAPPPRDLESQGLDEVEIQRMGGRRRPSLAVRRRDYAQAEDLRERGQERFCSRSPVRPMGRRDDQNRVGDRLRYRVRSPLRHESLDVQRQRDDRKDEKQESIRCFACNETGT